MWMPKFIATVIPKTWNRGRQVRITSRSPSIGANQACSCWTLAIRLRWVSIAPFERPVVPPVYCKTAISSASTPGSTSRAGRPLRHCLKWWMPGPLGTLAMVGGSCFLSFRGASRFRGNARYSGIERITYSRTPSLERMPLTFWSYRKSATTAISASESFHWCSISAGV